MQLYKWLASWMYKQLLISKMIHLHFINKGNIFFQDSLYFQQRNTTTTTKYT